MIGIIASIAVLAVIALALARAESYGPVGSGPSKTISVPLGFVRLKGKEAPSFLLPELRHPGTRISLAGLRGKPLILNFWSSTCTVCASEAEALKRAYGALKSRVEFVGIDTADVSRAAALSFARRHGISYLLLVDESAGVADRYGLPGLPVTFFVSPSSRLLGEYLGRVTFGSLEKLAIRTFLIRDS